MREHDQYRTALVLQGGGALGAYECGVVRALYEKRPQFVPAVITGVSIGAINATILAGAKGDPIQTLDTVWRRDFTEPGCLPPLVEAWYEALVPSKLAAYASMTGNHGMYRIRPDYIVDPFLATSIYNLLPLRETLSRVIDLHRLNSNDVTRVSLEAVNVATSELVAFDNRSGLSFEHIIASASLPPSFPMTRVGSDSFWDGGLISNTPLSSAINCLEELDADEPDVHRELIVVELFPRTEKIPTDLLGVINRSVELRYINRLALDKRLFAKFNSFIDLRRDIDDLLRQVDQIPTAEKIRQSPGYKELAKHRKIDSFKVITCKNLPADRAYAGDFSRSTIELRIDAGYKDALNANIGDASASTLESVCPVAAVTSRRL
jgi:NTE family protein